MLLNIPYFNPRSLAGATNTKIFGDVFGSDFNPRSLAGATIHSLLDDLQLLFQSTLPRGSDMRRLLSSIAKG